MRLGIWSLLLLSTACARQLNLSQGQWLEARSEHFELRTDLDAEAARATIVALEQTRSVYLRALAWGRESGDTADAAPGRPFRIIELADSVELHEFARPEIAGFVAPVGMGERVVVFDGDDDPDKTPVLKHELAHAVAGVLLKRQPAWFAEGLAVFLEGTHRDPDGPRDLIGDIDNDKVQWLAQHTPMGADETMRTESAAALDDRDGARFELSAYELFHVLFNQRPAQLAAYMKKLAHGDDPRSAFVLAFPDLTPAKLDAMVLDSQQTGAHFVKLGVPLEPYQGRFEVHPLAAAEVHAQLGALFLLSPGIAERGQQEARARSEFGLALQLDPGNPEALEGRAQLEKETPAQHLDDARRAASAHPDSWRAQMLLAQSLPSPAEALPAAQAALQLAPDEPYVLAFEASLLDGLQRFDEALPLAQRAVGLEPSSSFALAAQARALAGLHRTREALASVRRALERADERASKKFVAALLALEKQLQADP